MLVEVEASWPQIGTALDGTPYVRDLALVQTLCRLLAEGEFCAVIGPRYGGKSLLLADVMRALPAAVAEPIFVDLRNVSGEAEHEFIASFSLAIIETLHQATPSRIVNGIVTRQGLTRLLTQAAENRGADLVLVLDHLETVPQAALRALLMALRTLHQAQRRDAGSRVVVLAASSLSIADLAFGPSSPFNIAQIYRVRDLDENASQLLVRHLLTGHGRKATSEARTHLLRATSGDPYLIPRLCDLCCTKANDAEAEAIDVLDVESAIQYILEVEAGNYAPFRETLHALETTPAILLAILDLLENEPRTEAELRLTDDEAQKLLLSGAVTPSEGEWDRSFAIRNRIYKEFLARHFHPQRVVRTLAMMGRWDDALEYLAQQVDQDAGLRSLFLETTVRAMQGASDYGTAARHLAHGLSRAFGLAHVCVYRPDEKQGRLAPLSASLAGDALYSLTDTQRPEVRAYWSEDYQVTLGPNGQRRILVPLRDEKGKRLGLIVADGLHSDVQSDLFLEFLSLLKSAELSLAAIRQRERQVTRLTELYEIGRQLTALFDLDSILQTVVEGAVRAVPAAQKGSLYVLDDHAMKLVMRASHGYSSELNRHLTFSPGEGLAGWALVNNEAYCCPHVMKDPRHRYVDLPELCEAKSALGVPLVAWNKVFGVLCVDNLSIHDAFDKQDEELLYMVAAEAAPTIRNAQFIAELRSLGERLNGEDLDVKGIFCATVESIARVSGATGFNMLLWLRSEGVDAAGQTPLVAVSSGLGEDYDAHSRPGQNRLARTALAAHWPLSVADPSQEPGIDPLAQECGTRAYACIPLPDNDLLLGVLFVHYKAPHVFSTSEIEMLSLFSNQAGQALRRVQLVAQLREQIGIMAHGTTTPLTALGYQLDELYDPRNEERRQTAYRLTKSLIADLNTMHTNALVLTRLQHGALQLTPSEFDLAELVREVAGLFELEAANRGIAIAAIAPEAASVCADRKLVQCILHNLVKNALGVFPANLKDARIELRVATTEGTITVSVTDNGRGIAREDQERVFQPFVSKSKRTGIGLHISRTIAERHGGRLTVQSDPGQGATFCLSLPLERSPR